MAQLTYLAADRMRAAYENAIAEDRQFDAHVLLIRAQDSVEAEKAKIRAWMEGPNGLAARQAAL